MRAAHEPSPALRSYRGDVHERAASLRFEWLKHTLTDIEGTFQIDVYEPIEVLLLDIEERLRLHNTGAVHEAVYPPTIVQHSLNNALASASIRNVTPITSDPGRVAALPADCPIKRLDAIVVHLDVDGNHGRAVIVEQFACRETNPAFGRCANDNANLTREQHIGAP
jgi:hypothetical protein